MMNWSATSCRMWRRTIASSRTGRNGRSPASPAAAASRCSPASRLDKFAWIGSYSAYLTPEVCNKYFRKLVETPDVTNQQFETSVAFGVGSEDFLYKQAVTLTSSWKERKSNTKAS